MFAKIIISASAALMVVYLVTKKLMIQITPEHTESIVGGAMMTILIATVFYKVLDWICKLLDESDTNN